MSLGSFLVSLFIPIKKWKMYQHFGWVVFLIGFVNFVRSISFSCQEPFCISFLYWSVCLFTYGLFGWRLKALVISFNFHWFSWQRLLNYFSTLYLKGIFHCCYCYSWFCVLQKFYLLVLVICSQVWTIRVLYWCYDSLA